MENCSDHSWHSMGRLSQTAALLIGFLILGIALGRVSADEVYLVNGDRLTGRILAEDEERLLIEHEAIGSIEIKNFHIDHVVRIEDAAESEATFAFETPEENLWEREVSLGYNLSRGNTENKQLSGSLFANRKTGKDELTLRFDGYYSSASRRMDAQRYGSAVRYAFSFGPRSAWYNFYKLEADHDRFANVDWRFVPSTGIGYWFADQSELKALIELGLGWERTNFRDATRNRSDMVMIPRAFASKTLFRNLAVSQDIMVLPNVSDIGKYRLRTETALTNPVGDKLALRISFIDEFDSDPAGETKKNDARLISSVVYGF